ncbi:MAG: hypothetical protein KC731_21845 [Myxococcales bacterium]|nr:hypothetical protein [Myxococcales bacterium]
MGPLVIRAALASLVGLAACEAPTPPLLGPDTLTIPVVAVTTSTEVSDAAPLENEPGGGVVLAKPLRWRGALVHPLCVFALVGGETRSEVRFEECGKDAAAPTLQGESVHYDFPRDEGFMIRPAFVDYRVLASQGAHHLLSYLWNGGGTGYFSGLVIVDATDRGLAVHRYLHGGDRCNGGITETDVHGATITFGAHVTPADLMGLPAPVTSDAVRDLAQSAASCAATARFRYTLGDDDPELVAVDFDGPADLDADLGERQRCFNRLFDARRGPGRSSAEVAAFVADVTRSCP